jgi:hypothetical protein
MKYHDGQVVRVGDKVRLGEDDSGLVVCSMDDDEYTDDHPRKQWDYLKKGVMIEFPLYGLIHYQVAEPDLQLVARAKPRPARGERT